MRAIERNMEITKVKAIMVPRACVMGMVWLVRFAWVETTVAKSVVFGVQLSERDGQDWEEGIEKSRKEGLLIGRGCEGGTMPLVEWIKAEDNDGLYVFMFFEAWIKRSLSSRWSFVVLRQCLCCLI